MMPWSPWPNNYPLLVPWTCIWIIVRQNYMWIKNIKVIYISNRICHESRPCPFACTGLRCYSIIKSYFLCSHSKLLWLFMFITMKIMWKYVKKDTKSYIFTVEWLWKILCKIYQKWVSTCCRAAPMRPPWTLTTYIHTHSLAGWLAI